jgi:hypothetical protein
VTGIGVGLLLGVSPLSDWMILCEFSLYFTFCLTRY